jgi:nitroimidazol reductase NimA-like FMN-containing flavoprotein (pyridoxamine 5'-phosphate oxidase superfamily)
MFRELRKANRALTREEAIEILEGGVSGVLAVAGDDDYPYTVPLNYAYDDGKLFFHCADAGHKLDAIKRNDKVSFCVVAQADVAPEKFMCYFRSVVAFGRARLTGDADEKRKGLEYIARKYSPGYEKEASKYIDAEWDRVAVVVVDVEHISAKTGS